MRKRITSNQLLGELGESAVRTRFLKLGFQFDSRSRLEVGIDGIAEVMKDGEPLARMIAVQIKSTESGKYPGENENGFNYTITKRDLEYWKPSNIPVIIVLYRNSDQSFYWKEIGGDLSVQKRTLSFSKESDQLNTNSVDKLAALTVPKVGFGYYIPPLGSGETALVNILPVELPPEIFIASTAYNPTKAISILNDQDEPTRFDWIINGNTFWSFHDPRTSSCKYIVDEDQVDAIETEYLAFHEDTNEQNKFAHLLKKALAHQVEHDLRWCKEKKLFFFRANEKNTKRTFHYESTSNKTKADVVNVYHNKDNREVVEFVRHHAFVPRFELIGDQWYLVITPTYYFTTNGFIQHSHPHDLLSGKKRMDNSGSVRGQVVMWHRFLTHAKTDSSGELFECGYTAPQILRLGEPPIVELPVKVPEDVWGTPKVNAVTTNSDQTEMVV